MGKNKMRTKNAAVCFSGQVKNLELCYPYIKKYLLDNLGSYDVFCYAEDDTNFKKVKMLKPTKTAKIKSSNVDKIIKEEIQSLKKLNYRKYIFIESFKFNFRNIYQQLFKIKGAFNLLESHMKEESISYKYLIRVRFDFLPFDNIKPENFNLNKNEVVVPSAEKSDITDTMNDMFCITKNLETFRSYCSLYENFQKAVELEVRFNPKFFQKIYFLFEKYYSNFFIFLLKDLNKEKSKPSRQLLWFFLLFPKKFYKRFKDKYRCSLERTLFYHLNSKNKKVRKEIINFAIVRDRYDGLLTFGD